MLSRETFGKDLSPLNRGFMFSFFSFTSFFANNLQVFTCGYADLQYYNLNGVGPHLDQCALNLAIICWWFQDMVKYTLAGLRQADKAQIQIKKDAWNLEAWKFKTKKCFKTKKNEQEILQILHYLQVNIQIIHLGHWSLLCADGQVFFFN